MITQKCFTKEYIEEQGKALQVSDLRNLEKCILALELTARLKREGLEFIFKGGTSLLLHCDPPRRLSVDVDILSLDPIEKFQQVLEQATKNKAPFEDWEHQDQRDREAPPTIHFKAFYTSVISNKLENVQLDVIKTKDPYAKIEERSINTSFIELEEETLVRIPCASSLLGDKIAAFAPTTIGFLYYPIKAGTGDPGEPRPIKVVKHLFDVAELASVAEDTEAIITTYTAIHAEQLKFRGEEFSIEESLADTQLAAYNVCRIGGKKQNLKLPEMQDQRKMLELGRKALSSHLFSKNFQQPDAQLAAAKAALVAQIISSNATDVNLADFIKSERNDDEFKKAELTDEWKHISNLRTINIEAFRIWHKAQELKDAVNP